MLESKVIRINTDVIEKLNLFISNDEKIDKMLHISLFGNDNDYIYTTGALNEEDINKWLKYAITYAIANQNRLINPS